LERSCKSLEDITGKKVIGHRAPVFSIQRNDAWVWEVLKEQGIEYDSSIYPYKTYLYGEKGAPQTPYIQSGIWEIPPAVHKFAGFILPVGGGGHFRAFPKSLTVWGIKRYNQSGFKAVIYLHPWELDAEQPDLNLPFKQKLIHNLGLKGMKKKVSELLKIICSTTLEKYLETIRDNNV
jgi:hypothetical protein